MPPPHDRAVHWAWTIEEADALAWIRHDLRERATAHGAPAPDHGPLMTGPVERLLLVFSELATNGLRHGVPPVGVEVARTDEGWLVVVSDRQVEAGPTRHAPDPRRHGQHGLVVVEAVSESVGWYADSGVKHVWATVPDVPPPDLLDRLTAS